MKQLLNERGGALLTVFFILILFMILGLSISTFMVQGGKQRAFADDEIQGKMLADMGLTYFQKYLEEKMNETENPIKNGVKDSTNIDNFVQRKLDEVASDKEDGKEYILPGENQGGFKLGYKLENVINYKDNLQEPSQPYVRKITLYSLGLPPRAVNGSEQAKQVQLTSTVYINTIPAPFHYAVSTPGELRLFGGTNIIGNVAAGNVLTSTDYRYLNNNVWTGGKNDSNELDGPRNSLLNQTYVEGTIYLSEKGAVSKLSDVPAKEPAKDEIFSNKNPISILSRTALKSEQIFTPKVLPENEDKTELSASKNKPYLPGYEPPIVEKKAKAAPLRLDIGNGSVNSFTEDVSDFIKERLWKENSPAYVGNTTSGFEVTTRPLSFEQGNFDEELDIEGFKNVSGSLNSLSDKLVIRSQINKPPSSFDAPLPLTVRLTGSKLEKKISQLYIGPSTETSEGNYKETKASVEMGHLGAFKDDVEGDPFTFTGSIYIKGNLDIVGDIKIKGTIYVDGDVVIREIKNIDDRNLAIVASGKINLTARNVKTDNESTIDYFNKWTGKGKDGFHPLSAFLYSQESLEIYSVNSFNRVYGGVATGENSSLEFNTKREKTTDASDDNYLASRFTIQFNRKIFEETTPGLPAGDTFFLDMYDIDYNSKRKLP